MSYFICFLIALVYMAAGVFTYGFINAYTDNWDGCVVLVVLFWPIVMACVGIAALTKPLYGFGKKLGEIFYDFWFDVD